MARHAPIRAVRLATAGRSAWLRQVLAAIRGEQYFASDPPASSGGRVRAAPGL
jgi:hypothetical protein